MYTVYGIKNCDTVKKALRWLEENKITYQFHDFKSRGASPELLQHWCSQVGWETLLNKKGLTWKQLPQEVRDSVTTEAAAIQLMSEKSSIIRRPVVVKDDRVLVTGFDASEFTSRLK